MVVNTEFPTQGPQTIDWRRRDSLSQISCTLVTVLSYIFAAHHMIAGETSLALYLFSLASANLVAIFLYQQFRNFTVFGAYLLLSLSLTSIVVITRDPGNTGLLWLPTYPVVIFSIFPLRIAAGANLAMIIFIAYFLFFAPPEISKAEYDTYFKSVALCTFALTSIFSYFQASGRNTNIINNEALTRELQLIASTDELTGLANRRDMTARMDFERKRAKRSDSEFSIILADVDYFKKINDNFGHDVGDQVLKAFSDVFSARFRSTDKVGRWGGEEFLVILPNTQLEEAVKLADEVRKSISQASLIPHMPNRLVTMSAGVASSSEGESAGELLKLADTRLYEAKDSGRNRIRPEPRDNSVQSAS